MAGLWVHWATLIWNAADISTSYTPASRACSASSTISNRAVMSSSVARSTASGSMPSSTMIRASVTLAAVRVETEMRSARPSLSRSVVGLVRNAPP